MWGRKGADACRWAGEALTHTCDRRKVTMATDVDEIHIHKERELREGAQNDHLLPDHHHLILQLHLLVLNWFLFYLN